MKQRAAEPQASLEFLRCLWALNHALERMSMRMEREHGVTAQQRFLLRLVGATPGISGRALAEQLHIDAGTLSASLKRLEERKLLKRKRDPNDARRIQLTLTTRGEAVIALDTGTVESVVAAVLGQRSPIALSEALSVIGALSEGLEAAAVAEIALPRTSG
ncbi:MAG: winged helix-turn-helix transcriptional regulator [Myxococcales bacterium]|nr:winged helix-turn-helix transcriptional regulator [Myxococcales bacterium]